MSTKEEEEPTAADAEKGDEGNLDYEDWNGIDVIEGTLCLDCGGTGKTMLMLHKIPFFREIIIGSFKCDNCNARNNEVTFGGEIQPKGSRMELVCTKESDLSRQLIKSDSAAVILPALEFEIPPGTQKGEISTIEGVLMQAVKALQLYQPQRLAEHPEVGAKVALVIMNLMRHAQGEVLPFTIVVDDCAGNSFIENPFAPDADPHMIETKFIRTPAQNESLGLSATDEGTLSENKKEGNYSALLDRPFGAAERASEAEAESAVKVAPYPMTETEDNIRLGVDEVITIPDMCPNCGKWGEFRSSMTSIPHFKEVLIMAYTCQFCGYRSNEIKGGGAIPARGQKIELTITSEIDLKRDVLKGDSAALQLPGIDLELQHGSLGGVYTTIEGLLNKIYTNLRDNNPFAVGDSVTKHHSDEESTNKKKFVTYLEKMKSLSSGDKDTFPFKLILMDPLANSFVSAPLGSFLPPEADINLDISEYTRSVEEEEEFGLLDMNTKDFETLGTSGLNADEYYNAENILPDRVTHVLPKSIDHPTPFAQGTQDRTQGGRVFESTTQASHSQSGNGDSKAPEGYKAGSQAHQGLEDFPNSLKDGGQQQGVESVFDVDSMDADSYAKRHFDDDSALADKFEAREEFAGRRDNFVFRLGSLGLGYYFDIHKGDTK